MAAKQKGQPEGSEDAAKRKAMPFEPRKTQSNQLDQSKATRSPSASKSTSVKSGSSGKTRQKAQQSAQGTIPEVVSRRMVQRVALFCGIPTALGMSSFILSYLSVSQGWYALPNYLVLFVSAGWFGLGVLGVSYGVLSASWDEESAGSFLGFSEFKTNWARTREAWRSQQQHNKESASNQPPK